MVVAQREPNVNVLNVDYTVRNGYNGLVKVTRVTTKAETKRSANKCEVLLLRPSCTRGQKGHVKPEL